MMLIALLFALQVDPDEPKCDDEDECRQACNSGAWLQCQALGDLLLDDDDQPEAVKLFEKACAKGVMRSCSKLAYYIELSGKDHKRALKLTEQACTGNDGLGCANLATWLWDAGPEFYKRAAEAAAKGCKLKDFYACGSLGSMYIDGIGLEKDPKKGAALLDQSCTDGSPASCSLLGSAYADGSAGAVNLKRAAALFEQACDQNYGAGCFQLSNANRRGLGLRRDRRKAQELLERACSLGVEQACPEGDAPEDAE
jgi:TPR repeat protein